tara:strand:- start:467 stop:883 length:417 start_codon:yes stop_codon:yes gene_type:complete
MIHFGFEKYSHQALLSDVYVLTFIVPGSKLCIRNGRLSLHIRDKGNGVMRTINNMVVSIQRIINSDNREDSLEYVTELMKFCLNKYSDDQSWYCKKLKKLLPQARDGLLEMSKLYADDAVSYSKVMIIVDMIDEYTDE